MTWFQNSDDHPHCICVPKCDCILGAQKLAHIYSCLQHSAVTWQQFFAQTTVFASAKAPHSDHKILLTVVIRLTTTSKKYIIKSGWSRGWPSLQPSWLMTVMGRLHYGCKSRTTSMYNLQLSFGASCSLLSLGVWSFSTPLRLFPFRLAAGSTRFCAGIVSTVRHLSIELKMADYSRRLYQQLEQETGVKTGKHRSCQFGERRHPVSTFLAPPIASGVEEEWGVGNTVEWNRNRTE